MLWQFWKSAVAAYHPWLPLGVTCLISLHWFKILILDIKILTIYWVLLISLRRNACSLGKLQPFGDLTTRKSEFKFNFCKFYVCSCMLVSYIKHSISYFLFLHLTCYNLFFCFLMSLLGMTHLGYTKAY